MNVKESIIQGLTEAVEYEKGNKSKAKRSIVEIADLPNYHGKQVKEIRLKKNLSQVAFAQVIGVAAKTVEAWESDRNIPSGPVQRLLSMMVQDDQILEKNNIIVVK